MLVVQSGIMAMCTICGGNFVAQGLSVNDNTKRLALGVSGIVVEVVKDPALPQPERDDQAWEAATTSLGRQLRQLHREGGLRPAG